MKNGGDFSFGWTNGKLGGIYNVLAVKRNWGDLL
jgi:hypothetical protein